MRQRWCFTLLLLGLLTVASPSAAVASTAKKQKRPHSLQDSVLLEPDEELFGLQVHCPAPADAAGRLSTAASPSTAEEGALLFLIDAESLHPDTPYEVRLSYRAVTPAVFSIDFARHPEQPEAASRDTSRELLNTEKLMFRTDDQGKIVDAHAAARRDWGGEGELRDHPEYAVVLRCVSEGVRPFGQDNAVEVPFNVVLATLVEVLPGVSIPMESLSVVVLLAVFAVFALTVIFPQVLPLLVGAKKRREREKDS